MAIIGSNTTIIASINSSTIGIGTDATFLQFLDPALGLTSALALINFSRHITDDANVIINANVTSGSGTPADDATWLVEMNRQLEYRRIVAR